jgi:integrase
MAKASVCRRAVDLAIQSAAAIYAGLRVGEIAALTIGDVVTTAGEVCREIKLSKHQTKRQDRRSVGASTS